MSGDLQHLEFVDRVGFHEAWIGEHFTAPWEPNPAPDLLIAQALPRTRRMKLCPGAHLLPYHHPVELAHRVAFLDHMRRAVSCWGLERVACRAIGKLFNVDGAAGENRRMTLEALDIMLRLWKSEEPFAYQGEFWSFNRMTPCSIPSSSTSHPSKNRTRPSVSPASLRGRTR